jgi:tritrans,polycis-undecaprenyl-diphosphate synthase [geranylgeranyl-diphosphate specific]
MSWIRKAAHNSLYKAYERLLQDEVLEGPIPRHIAIIQDGNRRYADKIGEPRVNGHVYGAETTENVMNWCIDLGVQQITLYSFSAENYGRPEDELAALFSLLEWKLDELYQSSRIYDDQVAVRMIGDREHLPQGVIKALKRVEEVSHSFTKHYLNIALAYGGRQGIVDVTRSIAKMVENGELNAEDIDENLLAQFLYRKEPIPNVDLIIRSGGESRTSNFLPWHANGNECASYFCAPYWPEFRKIDLLRAIRTYQMREREKRRNAVRRAVHLLSGVGRTEVEEVFHLSKKACRITRAEVAEILGELTYNLKRDHP